MRLSERGVTVAAAPASSRFAPLAASMSSRTRIAFTGPFSADHHTRALDALCDRLDGGARDILYIVATGTARRRAISDLLARRGAVFGLTVKTMSSLPGE